MYAHTIQNTNKCMLGNSTKIQHIMFDCKWEHVKQNDHYIKKIVLTRELKQRKVPLKRQREVDPTIPLHGGVLKPLSQCSTKKYINKR